MIKVIARDTKTKIEIEIEVYIESKCEEIMHAAVQNAYNVLREAIAMNEGAAPEPEAKAEGGAAV